MNEIQFEREKESLQTEYLLKSAVLQSLERDLAAFDAVGTAQAVTQVASAGLESSFGDAVNNILYIMLIISVNLGIVNLLPLPALDGGRIVFLLIEAIFRRPVPARYERWVHAGGFALFLCLMVAVTFNDIARIVTGG